MNSHYSDSPQRKLINELSPVYVTMTDDKLSGWGQADNRISKLVIMCKDFEQAYRVRGNAHKRGDFSRVSIRYSKPRYPEKTHHTRWKLYDNLCFDWKRMID